MLEFHWLCQHSGRRNENLAHLTRRFFLPFPRPLSPAHAHEEKYGWLARLNIGLDKVVLTVYSYQSECLTGIYSGNYLCACSYPARSWSLHTRYMQIYYFKSNTLFFHGFIVTPISNKKAHILWTTHWKYRSSLYILLL